MVMSALCPQLHSVGVCTDRSCKYKHEMHVCEVCNLVLVSASSLAVHRTSRRHQKRAAGLNMPYHCSVCQRNVPQSGWSTHLATRRHRAAAAQQHLDVQVAPEVATDTPGSTWCSICSTFIPQEALSRHLSTRRHDASRQFASYKAALEETEKDKHGITISTNGDFGIVDAVAARAGLAAVLLIENGVPTSRIAIVNAKLESTAAASSSSSFSVSFTGPSSVIHQRPVRLPIKFRAIHNGRYEDRIVLVLEDVSLGQKFVVSRPLKAIVGSKEDHELLKPKSPFVPRKKTHREVEAEVIPGEAPASTRAIPWVVKLPLGDIPKALATTLSRGSSADVMRALETSILPSVVTTDTYNRHHKTLLWVEEYRMEQDLEMYDIPDAVLVRHLNYYYLAVPGLAEKRPSVLVGDRILLQPHGTKSGRWFEGYVHVVRREEVGLRFHFSFQGWSEAQRFNVRFKLNRYPLRRQHQALDSAFTARRVLFPAPDDLLTNPNLTRPHVRITAFNNLIAANARQLLAVNSILRQAPGSVPFVIFGPPGTGKTVTVVEAILQIVTHQSGSRILACAPSNSAADLIALRLKSLGKSALFRFYAPSRPKDLVPDALLEFTSFHNGTFSCPPKAVLNRYRVIVSTCVSAAFAHGIGIPRGHFTHIFVDEAGQATEPEVMTPIKPMADNNTNICLSGDPRQLGPIIRSPYARALGLETSYLERLMKDNLYNEASGHGQTVVKLSKNFRSHPHILKFPNDRFYNGDLEACGDRKTVEFFIRSPLLASPTFPIVFHAITGKDMREASSPSFFNIEEATQVKDYVQKLRADRRFRITDADIGVITPYHAQCRRIRVILKPIADGIKVGSVEEFQGQERLVIIISTVRSSREFVEYDLKHTLGFVANPRRFNVSVTRAKALLIVIGDPSVLSLDPLWRAFLKHVHDNGGWKGQPIAPELLRDDNDNDDAGGSRNMRAASTNMNELTRRMEMLTLAGANNDDNEDIGANIDRPWREVE